MNKSVQRIERRLITEKIVTVELLPNYLVKKASTRQQEKKKKMKFVITKVG